MRPLARSRPRSIYLSTRYLSISISLVIGLLVPALQAEDTPSGTKIEPSLGLSLDKLNDLTSAGTVTGTTIAVAQPVNCSVLGTDTGGNVYCSSIAVSSGDITAVGDCSTGACGQSGTLALTGSLSATSTVSGLVAVDTANLANSGSSNSGHLHVNDSLQSTGTVTGLVVSARSALQVRSDYISDITGTGLQVSAGRLMPDTANINVSGPDISGNLDSLSIANDSHNHTGDTLSSVDISADTNLLGTANEIELSGDTLGFPDVVSMGSQTSFRVPTSTVPVTDVAGQLAFDTNAWASGYGALQVAGGTVTGFVVATTVTDPPSNGQVPKWNTGGSVTWEADAGGTITCADTRVAFADGADNIACDDGMTYNKTTDSLTVAGNIISSGSAQRFTFDSGQYIDGNDTTNAFTYGANNGEIVTSLLDGSNVWRHTTGTGIAAVDFSAMNLLSTGTVSGANVRATSTVTGVIVSASTALQVGSDYIQDITGPGLTIGGGVLNSQHTTTHTFTPKEAKLTGVYVTTTISGLDASAASAAIDGGSGAWKVLFDATTDEAAVWDWVLPNDWVAHGTLDIIFSLASATTLETEWEAAIQCVTPGDAADIDAASFVAAAAVAGNTVPGTAGHTDMSSRTLADDSCAAGDVFYVYLSLDSNDATEDDATGDRELLEIRYNYLSQ